MNTIPDPPIICIDCSWHSKTPQMSDVHPGYCVHHTPEYWEEQGYTQWWGDAAVTLWPQLLIMRKQYGGVNGQLAVEYVILAPAINIRRPVKLHMDISSWGSF